MKASLEFKNLAFDIISHATTQEDHLVRHISAIELDSSVFKLMYSLTMPKYNNKVWIASCCDNKPHIIIERNEPSTISIYHLDTVDDLRLVNRLLNGFFLEMGFSHSKATQLVSTILYATMLNF